MCVICKGASQKTICGSNSMALEGRSGDADGLCGTS